MLRAIDNLSEPGMPVFTTRQLFYEVCRLVLGRLRRIRVPNRSAFLVAILFLTMMAAVSIAIGLLSYLHLSGTSQAAALSMSLMGTGALLFLAGRCMLLLRNGIVLPVGDLQVFRALVAFWEKHKGPIIHRLGDTDLAETIRRGAERFNDFELLIVTEDAEMTAFCLRSDLIRTHKVAVCRFSEGSPGLPSEVLERLVAHPEICVYLLHDAAAGALSLAARFLRWHADGLQNPTIDIGLSTEQYRRNRGGLLVLLADVPQPSRQTGVGRSREACLAPGARVHLANLRPVRLLELLTAALAAGVEDLQPHRKTQRARSNWFSYQNLRLEQDILGTRGLDLAAFQEKDLADGTEIEFTRVTRFDRGFFDGLFAGGSGDGDYDDWEIIGRGDDGSGSDFAGD